MQMTDGEVVMNVMQAKDQKAQIKICAQLNAASEDDIKEILKKNGVDLRKLKTEKKKNIHGIKQKPHKMPYKKPEIIPCPPANAEKKSPIAELNERIESLIKQKAGIESEIEDLRAQLTKMIDMLAGRIAE